MAYRNRIYRRKNGIVQKFYQSVARGFTPAAELLPHLEIVSESGRQIFYK